jgi:hydroxypyruvate reductase
MNSTDPITFLRAIYDCAVDAADPAKNVANALPAPPPKGRVLVICAGKAAASMARAVELAWSDVDFTGIALCPYNHAVACERIEVIEAAHPVPDGRGEEAARRILAEAKKLTGDDMLLFCVSGGGSSLLALPVEVVSLAQKAAVNKALLHSGAPISAMNAVRKRLSAIKGGRLAVAAWPAPTVTLAISDVPGDDPGTIASGPTVPEHLGRDEVEAILERYGVDLSPSVRAAMQEPPRPDHPAFAATRTDIIARPAEMISAVEKAASEAGHRVISLGADVEGESRDVAREQAALVRQLRQKGERALILSGGETTVTVRPDEACGRGGRNTEFALALALELDGMADVWAMAADTDGIDGAETIAGCTVSPDTLARARAVGLDPAAMLAGHDSASLFRAIGDVLEPGPTRTNVNDVRVIWVG